MKFLLCFLFSLACAGAVSATPRPFTADFYLAEPAKWVDKPITLSVAYVHAENEKPREDGMRVLEAYTFNQHDRGGTISIVAPADVASKLILKIGTRHEYTGAGTKITMIQGQLKLEASGSGGYYIFVEK